MEKLIVKKAVEKTTSTGKPYKIVDVQKEDGTIISGVSAFAFKFLALDLLVEGGEIQGAIVIDGNYKNLVSGIEKPKGNPNFKTAQMERVMDKKAENIEKAQDNTSKNVKISATMRDAVLIATSLTTDQWHGTTMEEEVKFWREWLWLEWDNYQDIKPF